MHQKPIVYDRISESFLVTVHNFCSVHVVHTINVSMQAKCTHYSRDGSLSYSTLCEGGWCGLAWLETLNQNNNEWAIKR